MSGIWVIWFGEECFFVPKPLVIELLFLTYNGVRFFFRIIGDGKIFVSVSEFFSPRNQSAGYFFLK